METRPCVICGKKVTRSPSNFSKNTTCSKGCLKAWRQTWRGPKETRHCSICGLKVTRNPSQLTGRKEIACSRKCLRLIFARKKSSRVDNRLKVEKSCVICGKTFTTWRRRSEQKKTCSSGCYTAHFQRTYRKPPMVCKCVICGSVFTQKIKKHRPRKTCSIACRSKQMAASAAKTIQKVLARNQARREAFARSLGLPHHLSLPACLVWRFLAWWW